MQQRPMIELSLAGDQHACDIDQIHRGTAVYTALPEIEALLDLLEWPAHGKRLLDPGAGNGRSEEHTSELQSLMRISYAVFCLKKKKKQLQHTRKNHKPKLEYK